MKDWKMSQKLIHIMQAGARMKVCIVKSSYRMGVNY